MYYKLKENKQQQVSIHHKHPEIPKTVIVMMWWSHELLDVAGEELSDAVRMRKMEVIAAATKSACDAGVHEAGPKPGGCSARGGNKNVSWCFFRDSKGCNCVFLGGCWAAILNMWLQWICVGAKLIERRMPVGSIMLDPSPEHQVFLCHRMSSPKLSWWHPRGLKNLHFAPCSS